MRKIPGRRLLLSIHRWAGIASAVFLVVLALTGLALNHTSLLGLDRIMLRNGLILKRYGMDSGGPLDSFSINETDTITYYSGHLFYNQRPVGPGGMPVGFWSGQQLCVAVTREEIFLLSREGELIEKIEGQQMPEVPMVALGETSAGEAVLVTGENLWIPDDLWLEFVPYAGEYTLLALNPVQLPLDEVRILKQDYRGEGVSLYRVLLDLHSGRLFGGGGRIVMDLTALAVLVLVSSGIAGWRRRSRDPAS